MTMMAPIVPASGEAEFRASGTDLSERRRSGVSRGPLVDISPSPHMIGTAWDTAGAARIGASTSIAAIAADARLAAAYPGVAAAAGGLATPQIRHLATLGGNLAQRSRCWYYRNPHIACLKKGGNECPAREGNHLYGVVFDLGPCVAPHPSTMAAALLAYEAKVATNQRQGLSIEQLLGDGSNGAADHALEQGEMIEAVELRAAGRRRTRGLQARDQPRLRRMAAGRGCRARRHCGRRVPVRAPRGGRGRAGPDPARRGRGGGARRACFGIDHCGGGPGCDCRREAPADDGLQARPARGSGPGPSGAVHGLTANSFASIADHPR